MRSVSESDQTAGVGLFQVLQDHCNHHGVCRVGDSVSWHPGTLAPS